MFSLFHCLKRHDKVIRVRSSDTKSKAMKGSLQCERKTFNVRQLRLQLCSVGSFQCYEEGNYS